MRPDATSSEDQLARLTEELEKVQQRLERLEGRTRVPRAQRTADTQKVGALESRLGTWWLSRAGIIALITGLALLVVYRFDALGVWLRILLGYGVAGGLAAFGLWLARTHRVFGRILFAGGLALGYFTTYALHFVPATRVLDSQAVALALLTGCIVGIVAIAHRMQSETVAGIALFLGLHTGFLSDVSQVTLLLSCLLAAGAVFFLVANRWVLVPLSGLVAVYTTHAHWVGTRTETSAEVFGLSLGFIGIYFGLFAFAVIARARSLPTKWLVLLPLANAVGAGGLCAVELAEDPALSFRVLAALGGVHLLLAVGAWLRAPSLPLRAIYLTCAVVLFAVALPFQLSGGGLSVGWSAVALAAAVSARIIGSSALRWTGLLVMASVVMTEVGREVWGLFAVSNTGLWVPLFVASGVLLFAERLHPRSLHGEEGTSRMLHVALLGVAVLTMSGVLLPAGLTTVGWAGSAFALFVIGFLVREARYRWTAFGCLALTGGRLILFDLSALTPNQRIVTFLVLGVALLAVSYVYTRLKGSVASDRSSVPPTSGD